MSACAVLLLASLQAAPTPGPPIAVEAVQHGATEWHVFSQQSIPLTLRVYGGQGRRLDLRAEPYQLAQALAAPIGPAIDVATGAELGTSAWHDFPLVLDCPAVERAVSWELRLAARMDGEEAWRPVGRARLELHPPDLLGPLRAHARQQPWFVSDGQGALKAFLNREGIPFRDLEQPGGREAWAGSRGARLRGAASAKGGTLLLLVRASDTHVDTPLGVVLGEAPCALVFEHSECSLALRLDPGRTRVTLDLGLIARLTDDPRAQLALVQAIELTQPILSDD